MFIIFRILYKICIPKCSPKFSHLVCFIFTLPSKSPRSFRDAQDSLSFLIVPFSHRELPLPIMHSLGKREIWGSNLHGKERILLLYIPTTTPVTPQDRCTGSQGIRHSAIFGIGLSNRDSSSSSKSFALIRVAQSETISHFLVCLFVFNLLVLLWYLLFPALSPHFALSLWEIRAFFLQTPEVCSHCFLPITCGTSLSFSTLNSPLISNHSPHFFIWKHLIINVN